MDAISDAESHRIAEEEEVVEGQQNDFGSGSDYSSDPDEEIKRLASEIRRVMTHSLPREGGLEDDWVDEGEVRALERLSVNHPLNRTALMRHSEVMRRDQFGKGGEGVDGGGGGEDSERMEVEARDRRDDHSGAAVRMTVNRTKESVLSDDKVSLDRLEYLKKATAVHRTSEILSAQMKELEDLEKEVVMLQAAQFGFTPKKAGEQVVPQVGPSAKDLAGGVP